MTQNVSRTWTIMSGDYIRIIDENERIGKSLNSKNDTMKKFIFTVISGAILGIMAVSTTIIWR